MGKRPLIGVLTAIIIVLAGVVALLVLKGTAPAVPLVGNAGTGGTGVIDFPGPGVSSSGAAGAGGPAGGAEGEVPVAGARVAEGAIGRPVRLTGNVAPARDVTLVSKVPGTVVWVAGGMGHRVEAGEPVVRLDDTELQLTLAQAQAGYAAAKANLARLEAGAAPEELAQVEAGVEQARLGLERVAGILDRQEQLYSQGVVSEETLQGVRTEHDIARLQYESALQQLALVRRGATAEERDAVRAQVQQAEAALKLAEQHVADTVIRTPFGGLLASQPAQVGMLIGAGTPVAGVVDIDRVIVEANVGEREINHVRTGDEVSVLVDALGQSRFVGHIEAVAPVADRQTGTFPVRVVVANPDHVLKPGMVARVELLIGATGLEPVIPKDAVVRRTGGPYVYVAATDGAGRTIARERPVVIDTTSSVAAAGGFLGPGGTAGEAAQGGTALGPGSAVVVGSGLQVGEVVLIAEPGVTLQDGTLIRIVREAW